MQGPEAGEYRGLSADEQKRMNEMYRDLNEHNARAIKIIESREAGECSCGWFVLSNDPYCAVHAQDTIPSPDRERGS